MFVYHIFMTSPLWLSVGHEFLDACPFDYTALAVSGKVEHS